MPMHGPQTGSSMRAPAAHELTVDAAAPDRVEDLPRSGGDRDGDVGVHGPVGEDGGHRGEVVVGGVHRGADAHLNRSSAGDIGDRDDVAGRLRHGDQRLQRGEVDLFALVVAGAVLGAQLGPLVSALLRGQPLAHPLVAWEDRPGRARLDDHVADRGAFGDRQRGHAVAGELEDRARAAAHTVSAQQFQDDVLGLHPVGQSSRQRDLDDARRAELVAVAGHRDGDVEATGAGREHPNGTGHRRV